MKKIYFGLLLLSTVAFSQTVNIPDPVFKELLTTSIEGNNAEFIFEGIDLLFEDSVNDGMVVFKIKTFPTLAQGDTFKNSASTYFDYNFPDRDRASRDDDRTIVNA